MCGGGGGCHIKEEDLHGSRGRVLKREGGVPADEPPHRSVGGVCVCVCVGVLNSTQKWTYGKAMARPTSGGGSVINTCE